MATTSKSSNIWHPTEYLRIAYKRRWIAIPGFLLVFLYGAVDSLKQTPMYEARTQIIIDKEARRATSIDTVLAERDSYYADDFYPTQQRIIQSRTVAAKTAAALVKQGVRESVPATGGFSNVWNGVMSLFGGSEPTASVALFEPSSGTIQGGLAVTPIRTSRIFELSFRSTDPNFAAAAVNEHTRQYMAHAIESRFLSSQEADDFLTKQLEEQRMRVDTSERALQAYKENNNALAVNDNQNIVVQRLNALNQQVVEARLLRIDRQAIYERMLSLRQSGESLRTLPSVMGSGTIQLLETELTKLQAERAQMSKIYGPEWSEMRALAASIETTQAKLNAEIARAADAIESDYETARAKENALAASLEAQKGEAMGLDRKAIEYAALERDAEGNREVYQNLMARANETGVVREFRGSNIEVVDPAMIPGSPVSPNVRRALMFSAMAGLLVALGLVFAFEYFDSRIKSPEEIKNHLGLSFLGLIPAVPRDPSQQEAPLLSASVPPSFSEAIRGLRTSVLFSSAEEGARTVVVTSTGPSEGKTVVSSSLAISLAQAGQRTLVIDADMRRPRLHEAIGRSQEPGLSNVLVNEASLGDALRQTTVENLWILAAGHIPPNPAELLGSKKFGALLKDIKAKFDWIIVDAPPVMPVTDAAVVANISGGGVIFVVGAEMTQWQAAQQAIEQLKSANAHFIGAVLNRVNVQRHSYYYAPYYKKEYNKYYQRSANRV